MNLFEMLDIEFPITIWDRSVDGFPDNINVDNVGSTFKTRFVLSFKPFLYNPFGDSLNETFNDWAVVSGYMIHLQKGWYDPDTNTLKYQFEVHRETGEVQTVNSFVLIINGVLLLTGGIVLLLILSKVETIIKLPTFWIILTLIIMLYVIPKFKR